MHALEFENRMYTLMPGIEAEAMRKLLTYADELERLGKCPRSQFFKETYVQYSLVKRDYHHKTALDLFNLSKIITLKPLEIRGAANLLRDGAKPEEIRQKVLDGLCDLSGLTEQEIQEHKTAVENMPGSQTYKDELWFADLCWLLEKGFCNPPKDNIRSVFEACGKLGFTVGYMKFASRDYVINCREQDKYSRKRVDCLLYFLEATRAELTEYSEGWDWKVPKPGCLKKWSDAAFRFERLQQMIDETLHRHKDFEDIVKVYVGTIGNYSCGMTHTQDPHPYIELVELDVDCTSNMYSGLDDKVILHIDHQLGIDWLISGDYDVERHKRYDEGKTATLRAYVDSINYIKKFEWVEE